MGNRHERLARRATAKRRHHWLVSAELVYLTEDERQVTTKLNAIHMTDVQQVSAVDLGKIQQNLQLHFHQRSGRDPENHLKVLDITVFAVSHLGHMTQDEFTGEEATAPTSEAVVPLN